MCRRRRNAGFTFVEMLILIGIFGCIVVMLLPAIQSVRESARRMACARNMQQLGPAIGAYEQAHQRFPPSSSVARNAKGTITAVDGWSWIVAVLPYWVQSEDSLGGTTLAKNLYDSLDVAGGQPLAESAGAKGTPHADALAVSLPGLLCPSFGGSPFADPVTRRAAITNYRAMGATHIESLSVASPRPLTPKYGPPPLAGSRSTRGTNPLHPDGACFPGDGVAVQDFDKGLGLTIILMESIEPRFSRWTVGAEAALVGLPPNVEFEKDFDGRYTPKGYRKALAKSPEADSTYWTYRTYLEWDYGRYPYDGASGKQGGQYGPSSSHPTAVNHLFGDGHVQALRRSIDPTIYMCLIARHEVTPFGSTSNGKE
jgi:type II secretory pathway pseudopilin PulG